MGRPLLLHQRGRFHARSYVLSGAHSHSSATLPQGEALWNVLSPRLLLVTLVKHDDIVNLISHHSGLGIFSIPGVQGSVMDKHV